MKKTLLLVLIFIIAIQTSHSQEEGKTYGVLVGGGIIKSYKGTVSEGLNLKGLVNEGTAVNVGLRIKVSNKHTVEFHVSNDWMTYRDEMKMNPEKSPAFAITGINFENSYYLFKSRVSLKALLGPGIYYWRFTKDGPFGDPQIFEEEEFKKISIGASAGFGFELVLFSGLSLSVSSRYHLILSKDRFTFGEHFSEQQLIDVRTGIIYNF